MLLYIRSVIIQSFKVCLFFTHLQLNMYCISESHDDDCMIKYFLMRSYLSSCFEYYTSGIMIYIMERFISIVFVSFQFYPSIIGICTFSFVSTLVSPFCTVSVCRPYQKWLNQCGWTCIPLRRTDCMLLIGCVIKTYVCKDVKIHGWS